MDFNLIDCPFCADKAHFVIIDATSETKVTCDHCGASSRYYENFRAARQAWNSRKTEKPHLKKQLEDVPESFWK